MVQINIVSSFELTHADRANMIYFFLILNQIIKKWYFTFVTLICLLIMLKII